MLKRLLNPTPFKLALLIGLVFAALHFVWRNQRPQVLPFTLLDSWDASALDAKFRQRGRVPTSGQVVIAGVDEASVQRYGLWPWRRELVGRALKNLNDAGARAVGVDMWFSDPDRLSPHRLVNKLIDETLQRLPQPGADGDELRAMLEASRAADPDQQFADLLREAPRVVLGASGLNAKDAALVPEAVRRADEEALERFSTDEVYAEEVDPDGKRLNDWSPIFTAKVSDLRRVRAVDSVQLSLPVITAATRQIGLIDSEQDPDGPIRRYRLFRRFQERLVPSLALATVAVGRDAKAVAFQSRVLAGTLDAVGLMGLEKDAEGRLRVPVDPWDGTFLINYAGPFDPPDGKPLFPIVSLADAVDGTFDKDLVKDRYVLVGALAVGTYDQRVTPFDKMVPGVSTHAAVVDNILSRNWFEQTAGIALVEILLLLLVAIAFGLIVPRFDAYYWQIVFMGLMCLGYLALDYLLFTRHWVLSTVMPIAEMAVLFVGILVLKLVVTDREKRQVRTAFQHYLTRSVMEEMLKHPEKLKLGGEKRDLTVLFSDIRGFTTISERLPPEELVRTLNEYLTPMTNIVFKHEGTLDKYMGDAIMAIWGAPLGQEDHALRACAAAVEMLKGLETLRAQWKAQNRPDIRIGIGLNSGPMSVGNMGSTQHFAYTVMGDNVNLGSRLEGTNKAYGTEIIISEFTYAQVKGRVVARELGSVRVKGKKLPVGIYELRGMGTPSPEEAAVIADFEAGIAAYRARNWDEAATRFHRVLAVWDEDGPSAHYLEDIEDKRQNPPAEGWDGVYEMKTK